MSKRDIIKEILLNNPNETEKHLQRLSYKILEGQLIKYRKYNKSWRRV